MKKDFVLLIAGAVLFASALFVPEGMNILRLCMFLSAFVASGLKVIVSAVKGIAKGNFFNENTLMVVAAIGAFCIKEYPEAVFVCCFTEWVRCSRIMLLKSHGNP